MEKTRYQLKCEIEKLEQEKVEEQFHYDSIPVRKKKTLGELRVHLLFLCPQILLGIASLVSAVKAYRTVGAAGSELNLSLDGGLWLAVRMTVFPILSVAITVEILVMLYGLREELRLLIGRTSKSASFGAANYGEERKISEEKLRDLNDEILELQKQLRQFDSAGSYEERIQKRKQEERKKKIEEGDLESLTDEEFLLYAYGTWGEDEESVRLKLGIGGYEKEREQILEQLERAEKHLSVLAAAKRRLEEEHEVFRQKVVCSVIVLAGIALLQVFFKYFFTLRVLFGIFGFFYGLITMLLLYRRYRETEMLWLIEHRYRKMKNYAEKNRLVPFFKQKTRTEQEMSDAKRRLTYVDRMLKLAQKKEKL